MITKEQKRMRVVTVVIMALVLVGAWMAQSEPRISENATQYGVFVTGEYAGLGSNKLVNPGFTGSASGWTLGGDATYSSNALAPDGTEDAASYAYQTGTAFLNDLSGRMVQVGLTLASTTAGSVGVFSGEPTTAFTDPDNGWSDVLVNYTADGTYLKNLKATGAGFYIVMTPTFDGTVDDVVLKELEGRIDYVKSFGDGTTISVWLANGDSLIEIYMPKDDASQNYEFFNGDAKCVRVDADTALVWEEW